MQPSSTDCDEVVDGDLDERGLAEDLVSIVDAGQAGAMADRAWSIPLVTSRVFAPGNFSIDQHQARARR